MREINIIQIILLILICCYPERLKNLVFEIEDIRYFERRGDTKYNQYLKKPEYFYEYIMVLKKINNTKNLKIKISDQYSKTYYRKEV